MGVGRLWRCGGVVLVPDIEYRRALMKSHRAFEVGRLERMTSEIVNTILKSK